MTYPGFDTVLDSCLRVRSGEEVLLLTDEGTDPDVVAGLTGGISSRGAIPLLARMPMPFIPGAEPPRAVAAALLTTGAAIELTSLFVGSSKARRRASAAGVRYLAMPGVELGTFRDGGPLTVDFDSQRTLASAVGAAWDRGSRFRLTSEAGTDLRGSIENRAGRVLDGIARADGQYMAPPDIEAGTAPVEETTTGVAVIDGDLLFMGRGPLPEPVVMHFEKGRMVGVEGTHKDRLKEMMARCDDERMSNLAEVSMGLNPLGTICGVPMETESALGTAHIALGNSIAYGGTVNAAAHLDCVMASATLEIDGRVVISDGELGG
ncbi:MAG: aminopeptidase [bacterium]|nr:aminopeptidase [bacterium]